MSPRAAWRLEQLGFVEVYEYSTGKIDWISAGWAAEGPGPAEPRVLTATQREVPTCDVDEPVGEVRRRLAPDITACVVVNSHGIVAGRVEHLDAIDPVDPRPAGAVMKPGPTTIRPSENLGEARKRMVASHVPELLVTSPDGELLGILRAE